MSFELRNNTANASFAEPSSCVTVAGSCAVAIKATQPGDVHVHAKSPFGQVRVGGSFAHETDGAKHNSPDAHLTF